MTTCGSVDADAWCKRALMISLKLLSLFVYLQLPAKCNFKRIRKRTTYKRKRKKVEGILIRECPVCGASFNTMEQRKIYCSRACKTKSGRLNSIK